MTEHQFDHTVFKGTGLPNSCGLIAAGACAYLTNRDVSARVLVIQYAEEGEGHSVVVFESGSSMCVYDYDGTARFTDGTFSWDTEPIFFATTWVESHGFDKRVMKAIWQ